MFRGLLTKLSVAVVASAFIVPSHASQVLTNGNFDAGITGWTSFITANGTITDPPNPPVGPQTPQIATTALFDVAALGASNALFLNAGGRSFTGTQQGGGISQTFTTTGGLASFESDIAAWTRSNSVGIGLLSVLLDGVVMDFHNFGDANGQGSPVILRSTLDFTTSLAAGNHTIELLATRGFAPASGVTNQYFDNVSLDVTAAVPEPSTWAMMILGFAGIGVMTYRRRNRAMLAA
jgi:hypothetical protein